MPINKGKTTFLTLKARTLGKVSAKIKKNLKKVKNFLFFFEKSVDIILAHVILYSCSPERGWLPKVNIEP